MRLFTITLLVHLIFILSAHGSDSLRQESPPYSTTLTLRTHSMGFFSYGGRIVNQHPSADFFFSYQRSNGWGINLFKVVDLNDVHSGNNFLLLMANKNITLTPKLSSNLYGGVFLEQAHHFASHGSDVVANVLTSYKVSKSFTMDHMALLGNLIIVRSQADWVNRFRLLFTQGHWDVTTWTWFNNHVFDKCSYQSGGLSVYYSRIPITKKCKVNIGLTGIKMIHTTDEAIVPRQDGVLVTLAATWH